MAWLPLSPRLWVGSEREIPNQVPETFLRCRMERPVAKVNFPLLASRSSPDGTSVGSEGLETPSFFCPKNRETQEKFRAGSETS
jgi:hypothetical protein